MLFSVAVICFVFVCFFVSFVFVFFNLFYVKSFIYYKIEIVLGNNIFFWEALLISCFVQKGGGAKYVYLYYLGALRLLFCEFCSEYRVNRVRIEYRIE